MKGILTRAFESGELLEMIYQSDKGEISQRKIKVLKVSTKNIIAFCYLRHKPRLFKLDNILSIGPFRKNKKGA
jgi:predicted DNA-binding transcriptional regulator YafY